MRTTTAVLLLAVAAAAFGQGVKPAGTPDVVSRGKRATALVERPGGTATAFCIEASGLFITNAHVVQSRKEVALVLNPSEKDELRLVASVLRVDPKLDLALLRARHSAPLPHLSLVVAPDLHETLEVTAFGYPFGKFLATGGGYPSISVSTGKITSLRKQDGRLERIQLDASLNPGNSGGPVVDAKGRLVGVVESGVYGAAVNFAIPAAQVLQFLETPDVDITIPKSVPSADKRKPVEAKVRVTRFVPVATPDVVQLSLTSGGKTRQVELRRGSDGAFSGTFVPAPQGDAPLELAVTATLGTGSIEGRLIDGVVTVGAAKVRLAEIARIEAGPPRRVLCTDGRTLNDFPKELEAARLQVGTETVPVNLAKASVVNLQPIYVDRSIQYKMLVTNGSRTLCEGSGVLEIGPDVAAAPAPATVPATPPAAAVVTVPGTGTAAAPAAVATAPGAAPAPVPAEGTPSAPAAAPAAPASVASQAPGVAPAGIRAAPTQVTGTVERKLPDTITDVVPAAGGRFLILSLSKTRKLAVLDTAVGDIVRYLPVDSDNALVAAGMDKMLVALPDKNVLHRYSLATFEREITVTIPTKNPLKSMAMGHSSVGPAVLEGGELVLLDIRTMKARPMTFKPGASFLMLEHGVRLRCAADGSILGAWMRGVSPSGVNSIILTGDGGGKGYYQHESRGSIFPGPDGRFIFTSGAILSTELRPLPDKPGGQTIPAYQGPFYLCFVGGASPRVPRPSSMRSGDSTSPSPRILVCLVGESRPLFTIQDLGSGVENYGGGGLEMDKRYHYIPEAQLLIAIPATMDRLILRKFNLVDELAKSEIDYLFIASAPVITARKGTEYRYNLAVYARKGPVRLSLESAPRGMMISAAGAITWHVPGVLKDEVVDVIVKAKDALDQEVFHTFKINIAQ
jgi:hypothetical protein